MKTVHDILQSKGTDVWAVGPDNYIYEALELMADKNIGAVLVCEGGDVKGIFSERDYARKVILEGKSSRETRVRDAMTEKVAYVKPENSVEECMALMTGKRIRHLPVMDPADKLTGVISIGDVVQAKISEQQFYIGQLENFIKGHR